MWCACSLSSVSPPVWVPCPVPAPCATTAAVGEQCGIGGTPEGTEPHRKRWEAASRASVELESGCGVSTARPATPALLLGRGGQQCTPFLDWLERVERGEGTSGGGPSREWCTPTLGVPTPGSPCPLLALGASVRQSLHPSSLGTLLCWPGGSFASSLTMRCCHLTSLPPVHPARPPSDLAAYDHQYTPNPVSESL